MQWLLQQLARFLAPHLAPHLLGANGWDRNRFVVADKSMLTPEGGIAVRLINKTGAASVKGTVVRDSTTVDNGVEKIIVDVPSPCGVLYEDGVADGAEVWVVIAGMADVYYTGSTTPGTICRGFISTDSGYVAGQALNEAYPGPPQDIDKHFYEIGHCLVARTGAGLARTLLHFN